MIEILAANWFGQALILLVAWFIKHHHRTFVWREVDLGEPHKIPIGYRRFKRIACIDFKKAPAWLITGTPGKGKSSLLIGIAMWICTVGKKYGIATYVLDGKMTGDYLFVEAAENGEWVADTKDEFLPWVLHVREVVEKRYMARHDAAQAALETGVSRDFKESPIIIILDEVVAATQLLDKSDKNEFTAAIDYIISQGRQAEAWEIWATQRPDAKDIGGARARENSDGKIAMGPHRGNMAAMVIPENRIELNNIPDQPGAGILKVGGRLQRIVTFFGQSPSDPDMDSERRKEELAKFGDVKANMEGSKKYHAPAISPIPVSSNGNGGSSTNNGHKTKEQTRDMVRLPGTNGNPILVPRARKNEKRVK